MQNKTINQYNAHKHGFSGPKPSRVETKEQRYKRLYNKAIKDYRKKVIQLKKIRPNIASDNLGVMTYYISQNTNTKYESVFMWDPKKVRSTFSALIWKKVREKPIKAKPKSDLSKSDLVQYEMESFKSSKPDFKIWPIKSRYYGQMLYKLPRKYLEEVVENYSPETIRSRYASYELARRDKLNEEYNNGTI